MKKFIAIAAVLVSATAFAQPSQTFHDGSGTKIIRDFIAPQQLATDTAFKWFGPNQQGYTPEANALNAFRANRDSVNFLVFGGTWCGDTQGLLPKFLALTGAAGISPDRITIVGVDHSKKAPHHLSEAFGVTRVPTFIVLKNGKEVGRVVEYGKVGMFDKELGEIVGRK